jgi:hypothetical protein
MEEGVKNLFSILPPPSCILLEVLHEIRFRQCHST